MASRSPYSSPWNDPNMHAWEPPVQETKVNPIDDNVEPVRRSRKNNDDDSECQCGPRGPCGECLKCYGMFCIAMSILGVIGGLISTYR